MSHHALRDQEVNIYNTMTRHNVRVKTFMYLTGLCLACIVGYLVGNFSGENYNLYSLSNLQVVSGNSIRGLNSGLSRTLQSKLPFGICDNDKDCAAIIAEDIEISTPSQTSKKITEEYRSTDVQARRRNYITKTCQLYTNLRSPAHLSDGVLKQLIVDEKHKVIYCAIPKAGCTNWKRLLMAATNDSIDMNTITKDYAHHNDILRTLYDYSQIEQHTILESYRKFTFVRNPFIRLLSAYKDKFESLWQYRDDPNGKYFRRYAADIMIKYRNNATHEELESGENVTWTEFITYVTHLAENKFNAHWMPMYKLCAPCFINYDFIGRIETIDVDAKRLLTTILRMNNEPKKFPHYFDLTTNSSAFTYSAYGDITIQQLRTLWNIYKWDFWLFGYKKPDFI